VARTTRRETESGPAQAGMESRSGSALESSDELRYSVTVMESLKAGSR
jgi:hypothetical protein